MFFHAHCCNVVEWKLMLFLWWFFEGRVSQGPRQYERNISWYFSPMPALVFMSASVIEVFPPSVLYFFTLFNPHKKHFWPFLKVFFKPSNSSPNYIKFLTCFLVFRKNTPSGRTPFSCSLLCHPWPLYYPQCLSSSQWPSTWCRGRGAQRLGRQGVVAGAGSGTPARSDTGVPGALRQDELRRAQWTAPHQGHPHRWFPGTG